MEFLTENPDQTEQVGAEIYEKYKGCRVFALYGDLGAGKTALTRGIARGAGTIDVVNSPTYAIVNEYRGPRRLYHFDMYRISGSDELYDIGWEDYLTAGGLCIVEWSQRVDDAFPPDTLKIVITKIDENRRKITVNEGDLPCIS